MESEFASKTVESPIGPISLFSKGDQITKVELNKRTARHGSSKILDKAEIQLKDYFLGKRPAFRLKTLSQGSEFQMAVWQEIAKLGYGQQTTYGEIARAIGRPKAVRAVGAAVGKNPIPIIVGCHRVLGSTGKLTGYTGGKGLATKRWLLEHEQIEFSN